MGLLHPCPSVIFQRQHLIRSLLCLKHYRGPAFLGTQTLLKQVLDPCQPCLLPFTAREPDVPQRGPYLTSHPSRVSMPSLCQEHPPAASAGKAHPLRLGISVSPQIFF